MHRRFTRNMASADTTTEKDVPNIPYKGVVGIANVGNTCYANASLQLLRHCEEWSSHCLSGGVEKDMSNEKPVSVTVLKGYLDILRPMWNGLRPGYIQPAGFWAMISETVKDTVYEDFLLRIPQDSHEFFVWLLDHQFMATQNARDVKLSRPVGDTPTLSYKAVEAWVSAFKKAWSPLTDMCFGLILSTTSCQGQGCNATYNAWDTFSTLKIQPGSKEEDNSFKGMLERELAEETIEDYKCDECGKRCTVIRRRKIWRLPRNLFVLIKRFHPDGTKNRADLEYDGTAIDFGKFFHEESPEISRGFHYKPFATVDHHGNHMGGHYTAQGFNVLSNTWWLYDDETAYPLKEGPAFGSTTYMIGLVSRQTQ